LRLKTACARLLVLACVFQLQKNPGPAPGPALPVFQARFQGLKNELIAGQIAGQIRAFKD